MGALLYVDATATIGGMDLRVDAWQIDAVSAGLQKCLSGPPGSAPVTFNERVVEAVLRRKHVEKGVEPEGFVPGEGPRIRSNYFDLAMLMDYWSELRLNHHTESTSMLYAARECARIVLAEGLPACFERHALTSAALTAGLRAMGLELFGDQAHKMANVTGVVIPAGVDGEAVRASLLNDFGIEIGTPSARSKAASGASAPWVTTAASRILWHASRRSRRPCASRDLPLQRGPRWTRLWRYTERRSAGPRSRPPRCLRRRRPAVGKLVWLAVNGRALAARR